MSSSRFFRRGRQVVLSSVLFGLVTIALATSAIRAGSIFDDDIVTPPQPAQTPQVAPVPKAHVDPVPSVVKPAPLVVTPSPAVPVPVGSSPKVAIALKRKIPEKADRDHLHKLFNEAYADQMKDRSVSARRKLAQSLLDEAAKNTNAETDYFVLLGGAIKSAEEGSSLRLTFTAIDQLAAAYEVDGPGLKVGAVMKLWATTPSSASVSVSNVQNSFGLIDEFLVNDDLTNALAVATLLGRAAHSIMDTELRNAALRRAADVAAIADGREKLNPSLEKLKTAPDDATASGAVGAYLCLTRGKWDDGLPYLAKGSDPVLKDLAVAELKKPVDPEAIAKIADGWWDAAASLPAASRAGLLQHAATIYRVAVPSFSGVRGLAVQKRIADTSLATTRRIDLLELFQGSGVIEGKWRLDDGTISCEQANYGRIEFPYSPPDEYDFRISFVVTKGQEAVSQLCYCADHQFGWQIGGWGNAICAIDLINGVSGRDNQTAKHGKLWLVKGQRYTSVVKVRKSGIQAFLNDQLLSSWKTDYSDMSLYGSWGLHHDHAIGIGAYNDVVKFDLVEVIEVTGQGNAIQ